MNNSNDIHAKRVEKAARAIFPTLTAERAIELGFVRDRAVLVNIGIEIERHERLARSAQDAQRKLREKLQSVCPHENVTRKTEYTRSGIKPNAPTCSDCGKKIGWEA